MNKVGVHHFLDEPSLIIGDDRAGFFEKVPVRLEPQSLAEELLPVVNSREAMLVNFPHFQKESKKR
jgi:hypothetical protein